ncbi:hypothetical protein GCWU000324_01173 [Kingella oralis ATCC 51147]|uniref:Uncharacterized protein n=1 Tax=Kingella oralis ATCC 51147 TaxID=629741 RepID=C4GGA5_9NEIS|nr:hypothetical protein GCWU000324_01173 [Kingella oralis ATCC 51147]
MKRKGLCRSALCLFSGCLWGGLADRGSLKCCLGVGGWLRGVGLCCFRLPYCRRGI